MTRTAHYLVVILVLMVVAIALQVRRDDGWQPYEPATPMMWLRAPRVVQRLSLGFDSLMADAYWIRAVVYFGKQRLSMDPNKNYDLLHPLLDLVTTLDPRFVVAYRFGAIFLSESPPGGPGRPDLAIDLLQRGTARTPERWEYPHDVGFIYYWHHRNFPRAAEWFDRATRVRGAPMWLKGTAATMLARGGDRESARMLWRQIYEGADNEWLKNTAEIRLSQFDALDAIDALNLIVWRYEARVGRMPGSWQELVSAGVLRGIPFDPAGMPYVLDLVNEDVKLAQRSPLWPLPEGFEAAAQ